MNIQEIKKFIKETVSYKAWEILVREKNGVPYLQVQFVAKDNFTGKTERQHCRKWQLSEWMTKTELVRTAFLAVVQAERHELEENFLYKGKAIFNSHLSADKLAKLASLPDATEHRAAPIVFNGKSPSPYEVGERIISNKGTYAKVTAKTELGFKYELEKPEVIHPLLGAAVGGECYEGGFAFWKSASWKAAD